jgi:23S rRNA (cytosine1962-C5)-methyltransferase
MTNTYRLEQRLIDEYTIIYGLDKYSDWGVLQLYQEVDDDLSELCKNFMQKYNLKGIYLKKRYLNDPKDSDLTDLIVGETAPDKLVVIENDIKFLVRLDKNLDVGLFLDHRNAREIIADSAKNKDVLNLFAYTSSFSVYSALNGAKSTTSVDLSNNYCKWSVENFKLNNLDVVYKEKTTSKNVIWKDDVFDFIEFAIDTGTTYDIIVLDPPSFSRNKTKHFSVQEDHAKLIMKLQNKLLNERGFLFFSTNYKKFSMDRYIRPGADKVTKQTIPDEFKPYIPHQSFVFYNV